MLYPSGGQTRAAKVTVTLASGEKVEGSLVSRDEFSIVMNDAAGKRNTFTMSDVKVVIDDPLSAHFEQLGKYTDTDMHNVFAYLETLR
jgi:cytochrome c oxidase cbb3-type subunit 3